jgi:hypothetical protein
MARDGTGVPVETASCGVADDDRHGFSAVKIGNGVFVIAGLPG